MPPEMVPIDGEGQKKRVVCSFALVPGPADTHYDQRPVLLLRFGRERLPLRPWPPVSACPRLIVRLLDFRSAA